MRDLHIGEFYGQDTSNGQVAMLYCEMTAPTDLVLIIYDEFGFQTYRKEYALPEGEYELELDCSSLSSGQHTAWVQVKGKTYLRNLYIEGNQETPGFFQRFKRMLSPRPDWEY